MTHDFTRRPRPAARNRAAAREAALFPAGAGIVLTAALLAACGPPPEPVAALRVPAAEVTLAYPGTATLPAQWRITAPLPSEEARLFVHLVDASGSVVRTFDRDLPFEWQVGETREIPLDIWQSALAPPLPPGGYELTVGLYEPAGSERWPLDVEAPEVDGGEYRVARVRVPPVEPGVGVELTGGWQPTLAGADRQVLARRWLVDRGSMELSGLPETARLELVLRLPEPREGVRIVLEEGELAAGLVVSSPCAEESVTVEGAGERTAVLLLRAGEPGTCTVRTDATFVAIDLDTLARRSVLLERLTWDPAGERGAP